MNRPRRTLHRVDHSTAYPPTWHFDLLNSDLVTPEYKATLSPQLRTMMDEYLDCKKQCPEMSQRWHWAYHFSDQMLVNWIPQTPRNNLPKIRNNPHP